MAGAIENQGRGKFQITNHGIEILKENPTHINIKYLTNKYGDYRNLLNRQSDTQILISPNKAIEIDNSGNNQTPEEQLELGYQKIRTSLQEEILSKLKSIHPPFFEKIVGFRVHPRYGNQKINITKSYQLTSARFC